VNLAVISDIHGNMTAFDAALADISAQGLKRIVCLGDAIQGGPQPVEVVAKLRELGCPVVMGNADNWLLTGVATDGQADTEQLTTTRAWSLTQLSDDDRVFIAAFVPTVALELEGDQRLLCFHGSPASFDDYILPETPHAELQRLFARHDATLLTGGHTHLQQIRRVDAKLFFNPGSVGRALDRNLPAGVDRAYPWAEYAIVTSDARGIGITFRQVPFDVERHLAVTRASGIPFMEQMVGRYASS
jgi:putative phosphoesterase